jgi:hypothetical protein
MLMRLQLVIVALVALATTRSEAVPMYTKLDTLRAPAVVVAIGTVHQDRAGLWIEIDRVIRGPATIGRMNLAGSPDGLVDIDGRRVVAFVDAGALRWVGELLAGPSIESGVLKLRGFFDFNAHIVSPGVMSLVELERYLQTGKLDQVFAATLAFHDSHGVLQPSAKTLAIKFDALTRAASMSGVAFACLDQMSVFPPDHGTLELSLIGTCPASPSARLRSLTLEGQFTGVDARTGALDVLLVPMRPFLDEKGFDTFVGDASWADVTDVVAVKLSDGSTWIWNLESDLVDPRGAHHKAGGVSSSTEGFGAITVTRDVYDFSGPKITISPSPAVGSPGGSARGVIPMVDAGSATCKFRRGGVDVACTLKHLPSVFVRR